MTLEEKAKEYLFLMEESIRKEAELKNINKEIGMKMYELYETMEDAGIPSIEIDRNGIKVKLEQKIDTDYGLAGELKGQQFDKIDKWFDWLVEIGEEGLIQTKKTVHPGTRKKFLKEWQEDGNTLPDFIEERYIQLIKTNKSLIKRMLGVE